MPIDEFHPRFLTEQQSKEIATRQILSFLFIGPTEPGGRRGKRGRAPSKALFAYGKIPKERFTDARHLLDWRSRRIYDVDGVLLFWDQTLELDKTNSLHVRVAASDLLRTPVWMVRAGETWNIDGLISKAVSVVETKPELELVFAPGEKTPRLICYGYPNLGILCASRNQPNLRFVVDLFDLTFIPVARVESDVAESVKIVWSPYDMVTRGTVAHFRSLSKREADSLPPLPVSTQRVPSAIGLARLTIVEELTTDPELVREGQINNTFCAPATARMILLQHQIDKSQALIAGIMGTSSQGTLPVNQANAITSLTSNALVGSLDVTTSFSEAKEEIRQNRPFKTGGIAHARACCGFRVDADGKEWLYIYDPLPANRGAIYFENWLASYHCNYMYVRPNSYT
ncbi:MAG TPA: hypothetical protein VFI57_10615 [Pyrinomonadaceae bacterium]|nr:hypothetical protein [Pyrinomonadaceae bacterium]